jgi:hypothetical protein
MRVVGDRGSDPDAKLACGTPRAERGAAAVAPSIGACWDAVWSATGDKRGPAVRRARGTNSS